jgi:uncharacterized protein (DUF3820 family)
MKILEILKCKECLSDTFTVALMEFENGTQHVQAVCAGCEKHLQFLKQAPDQAAGDVTGDETIPFGKHKGSKLKDLPPDYITWCVENMKDGHYTRLMRAWVNKPIEGGLK